MYPQSVSNTVNCFQRQFSREGNGVQITEVWGSKSEWAYGESGGGGLDMEAKAFDRI